MKTCIHCVGHVDGAKCKKRVCPGTFACQVLAKNGVKLIKVSAKVPKPPTPPAGATASVVPSVPPTPEDAVAAPEALTAVAVDIRSADTSDDYNWHGADAGLNYSFGNEEDGPAASDATLVLSAHVNLNASVSFYTVTLHDVHISRSPTLVLKLSKALSFLLTKGIDASIPA